MLRVCVVGAGSLGTYYAARLASMPATAVTLAKRSRQNVDDADGGAPLPRTVTVDLCSGGGPLQSEVAAVVRGLDQDLDADLWPFDLTLVTVKSKDTAQVGAQLARAAEQGILASDRSVVVSLQNGMGNADILRDALRDFPKVRVLQGLTYLGASVVGDQHVRLNGTGRTCVGPVHDPVLQAFAERMNAAETGEDEVALSDDVGSMVWTKLLANAVINPVTALLGEKNACVARPGLRPLVRQVCSEFEAIVAREDNVRLLTAPHPTTADFVVHVATQTGANTSSMLADVQAGRATEIEAINGFLTRRARDHGLAVPALEGLYKVVLGLEQQRAHQEAT